MNSLTSCRLSHPLPDPPPFLDMGEAPAGAGFTTERRTLPESKPNLSTVRSIDDPRVWLAAERTFLAWIRTGIALMGFGFVVDRFVLFLREFSAAHQLVAHR